MEARWASAAAQAEDTILYTFVGSVSRRIAALVRRTHHIMQGRE